MSSKKVDHGTTKPNDQPPEVFTVDNDSETTPEQEEVPVVTPGDELIIHSQELETILGNSPIWKFDQMPSELHNLLTKFQLSQEGINYFKFCPLKDIKQIVELASKPTVEILQPYKTTP